MAATNKCLAQSNKSGTGAKATKKQANKRVSTGALTRHDAPASQIDRAPSRAHSAHGALRRISRELPRWKRDHGLLHGQSRRRLKTAIEMAHKRELLTAVGLAEAGPNCVRSPC